MTFFCAMIFKVLLELQALFRVLKTVRMLQAVFFFFFFLQWKIL